MNKELYHKLITNKKKAQDTKLDNEIYRERIIALTEELLANETQTDTMQDVEYAFNNYVKTCVRHFKITYDLCTPSDEGDDDVLRIDCRDILHNSQQLLL